MIAAYWRPLLVVIAFYLVTRVIVVAAAYNAPQDRSTSRPFDWWPDNPLIRWDSGHYLAIMESGYPPLVEVGGRVVAKDTIAFFPLYPLLSRPVAALIDWCTQPVPGSPRAHAGHHFALVLVSHIFGLVAVMLFYFWSREVLIRARGTSEAVTEPASPQSANSPFDGAGVRAAMLLAAFPTAMYFSTGYSEGVFLTCIAAALLLQARGQPLAAALACGLSTATRPTGIVLALVLAIMNVVAARQSAPARARPIRSLARIGLLGVVSVSGLIAFQVYLCVHYPGANAYALVQRNWERVDPQRRTLSNLLLLQPVLEPVSKPFKYTFRGQFEKLAEAETWNAFVNVAVLALATYGLFRPHGIQRATFLIPIVSFLMGYLADPYTGGRLLGIARYQLAALPCFLLLAQLAFARRALVWVALLAGMLALQIVYTRGYVDWRLVS